MWEWLEANWLPLLAGLVALSCPLLHRWTHREPPSERSAGKSPREL